MQRVFPFQSAEGWSGSVRTPQALGQDFLLIVLVIANFCSPVFLSPFLFVLVREFWAVWPWNGKHKLCLILTWVWNLGTFSILTWSSLSRNNLFCVFSLLWISNFQRSEKDGLKTQLYEELWGFGQSHSCEPKWVGKRSSCPGWLSVSPSNWQRELQIQVPENSIRVL